MATVLFCNALSASGSCTHQVAPGGFCAARHPYDPTVAATTRATTATVELPAPTSVLDRTRAARAALRPVFAGRKVDVRAVGYGTEGHTVISWVGSQPSAEVVCEAVAGLFVGFGAGPGQARVLQEIPVLDRAFALAAVRWPDMDESEMARRARAAIASIRTGTQITQRRLLAALDTLDV